VEVTAGIATFAWSAAVHRFIPGSAYVPANLAAAAALLAFARGAGCDAVDLGLDPRSMRRGVAYGALGAAVVTAGVVPALLHPKTRELFVEERGDGSSESAYHLAVRIPFGTALAEELMFRGALLGILARRRPAWQAALLSSLIFGVWHVWPTHDSLERNPAAGERWERSRVGAVASTVGLTTAAGLGLSWLRTRSRSIVAPVVAHAVVNAVAYVGGRFAASRGT
jgi:membrane protease YdiL (CAAX protease family)